jgi:hypothetical protein
VGVTRILKVVGLLVGVYLAIVFGKPYYQYLMMFKDFGDAVDAGVARIQVAKSRAGADVPDEVLQAVQEFLLRRATELRVPLDPRNIQVRISGGQMDVDAAWVVPVKVLTRTTPLNFSLHQNRTVPQ